MYTGHDKYLQGTEVVLAHHLRHILRDGLGSLHRVDGDGAGLLDGQLPLESLLQLVLREVQFGEVVL